MLSDGDLRQRLAAGESDHVEFTAGVNDQAKFGEAICAFANDLADRRVPGTLFVGIGDHGSCAGIDVNERLLQTLLGFRTDGTITPPPMLTARRVELDGCIMAVVEVLPADNPPIKYKGRVCVRAGPRRGFATPEEERRLTERRRWSILSFDQQPVIGAVREDLDLLRFQEEYLPSSVHPDVLAENGRTIDEQLRAVGFISRDGAPTVTGLLVCGKDPRAWIPGAYVQFVRYPTSDIGDDIQDQKTLSGPLSDLFRQIDELISLNIVDRVDLSGSREISTSSYPQLALQELIRNALIHRTYEGTTSPVMIAWYADRVEVTSPGGPYGIVTSATFGQPGVTDARNPLLASAAKELGFVQRFGSGIPRARRALERNGNPPPVFRTEPTFVHVTIPARS